MVRGRPVAAVAAALVASAPGHAADAGTAAGWGEPSQARACVALDQDADRLACFDRLHGRTPGARLPLVHAPVATASQAPAAVAPPAGLLARRWALDAPAAAFELRPHQPVYLLPLSVTDTVNPRPTSPSPGHVTGVALPIRGEEVKFQVSAKTLAWRGVFGDVGDLWIGYTQSSRWQLYTGSISRPFRETNHEPELMLTVATDHAVAGWRARVAGVALNHQSNGRAEPLSRSWNRLIGHLGLERGDWAVTVRPWIRLREPADRDDNPDIEDHVGRGELAVEHAPAGGHRVSLRLRHSLRGGDRSRGSAEVDWRFPITGPLQGTVQLFSGYGESLIDYNLRQTRIGLGFALADWH